MMNTFSKITIAIAAIITLGLGFTAASVSADAIDPVAESNLGAQSAIADTDLTVAEMLTYALEDEYLALAEYQAIIGAFGTVRPFTNIVVAEQAHVDRLLPLFETYGVTVVAPIEADEVEIPASITAAIATGIAAEQANIAMYEAFLATEDLPNDVRTVFESLLAASQNHLNAFSRDRYCGVGRDMAAKVKNMFQWQGNKRGNAAGNGNKNVGTCPR